MLRQAQRDREQRRKEQQRVRAEKRKRALEEEGKQAKGEEATEKKSNNTGSANNSVRSKSAPKTREKKDTFNEKPSEVAQQSVIVAGESHTEKTTQKINTKKEKQPNTNANKKNQQQPSQMVWMPKVTSGGAKEEAKESKNGAEGQKREHPTNRARDASHQKEASSN